MMRLLKDSCFDCSLNELDKAQNSLPGTSHKIFCKVRNISIEKPTLTYCNNHPLHNPLCLTTPRGPIWAAVHVSFDSKPLAEWIRIPSELVPPQSDGHNFRIPYFRLERPQEGKSGRCEICNENQKRTITLEVEGKQICFCSVAHYFEWWLKTDPTAVTYQMRTSLSQPAIQKQLKTVPKKLYDGLAFLEGGEKGWVLEALKEVEILLMELKNVRHELLFNALQQGQLEFESPHFIEALSPFLLQIQSGLTIAGELLFQEETDQNALMLSVTNIGKNVSGYLKQIVPFKQADDTIQQRPICV